MWWERAREGEGEGISARASTHNKMGEKQAPNGLDLIRPGEKVQVVLNLEENRRSEGKRGRDRRGRVPERLMICEGNHNGE